MRRNALASVFHAWRNCLWVFMFHTLHTHSTPHITYLDWHHFALKCTESSSPAHKGSRIPKSLLDRPSPSKSSFSCNFDNCRCISSLCKHTTTCTVHTCIHNTHRTLRHTQQHTQHWPKCFHLVSKRGQGPGRSRQPRCFLARRLTYSCCHLCLLLFSVVNTLGHLPFLWVTGPHSGGPYEICDWKVNNCENAYTYIPLDEPWSGSSRALDLFWRLLLLILARALVSFTILNCSWWGDTGTQRWTTLAQRWHNVV